MPEETTLPQDQVTTPSTETPQPTSTPVTQPASTETPVQQTTTTQPTTPATPTAPAFDESTVTEKVSKSIIDKIAAGLGINKQEEKEQIPTDPVELAKYVKELSGKTVEETLNARAQAEKEAQEQQQKTIQEGAARFQTLWKSQYGELAEKGLVPKVTNAEDKADPGNVARVKLLTKLSEAIEQNRKNGIDYVPTLKEIYYENPNILSIETTTGEEVPISGGGRAFAGGGQMSYEKLHNTPIEELIPRNQS
jgi:hypothetical protein